MSGNVADKARYALREYDVRRGGGCDWYVKGAYGIEQKFTSCVYEHGMANSPAKVVRVLKEAVLASSLRPKGYVEPPTSLEKFEGQLYDTHEPRDYQEAKEVYEVEKAVEKAAGLDRSKISTVKNLPIILVAIAIGVLGYFLFGKQRG